MTKQEREELARGRGRPALPVDQKAVTGTMRLTPARWEKLRKLGAVWLSKAIDRAKEPASNE